MLSFWGGPGCGLGVVFQKGLGRPHGLGASDCPLWGSAQWEVSHTLTQWGCNPPHPLLRRHTCSTRQGQGGRGHCPRTPCRPVGPASTACAGRLGQDARLLHLGAPGRLRTLQSRAAGRTATRPGRPAITSVLSWLHDEQQRLSVSPRKGPLSLPVPLGAKIKCLPLHGPGHPVRVGRGLPQPRARKPAAAGRLGEASLERGGSCGRNWDKAGVLWDDPLGRRATRRL